MYKPTDKLGGQMAMQVRFLPCINMQKKNKVEQPHMDAQSARKEISTPANQRLMRQFMKNPEGERTSAFREGWERTFGAKKEEPKQFTAEFVQHETDCTCEACRGIVG